MRSPKFGADFIVALVVLIVTAVIIGFAYSAETKSGTECYVDEQLGSTNLVVEDQLFSAEIAESGIEKAKGLSDRNCIEKNHSMIFAYALTGDYCFWMKDMNFSIDIVWLDDDKKMINAQEFVRPDTYPSSFCPEKPAQYALEFASGTVSKYSWQPGTDFIFNL